MDTVTAAHAVSAVIATSRELVELWRKFIGAGSTMTVSGKLLAIGWRGAAGQRIKASARISAHDLACLAQALESYPTCRFVLVEQHKRAKMLVFQSEEDVAAGRIIQPSGPYSPLVIVCECYPGFVASAQSSAQ